MAARLAALLPLKGREGLFPLAEDTPQAVAAVPFQARLPIPEVLSDSHLEIPIREAEAQIFPGPKTRLWTYGGTFPGPTIRRRAGERTTVSFRHELPAQGGELSVHLHGGHNRTQFDGQPGGLTASQPISYYCHIPRGLTPRQSGNDLLIPPGGRKTYVYDLVEDGQPERAAFQWYHDHRLDHTAPHIWHGLAGMWIVDDELDASLPLPSGDRDIPLMIADRSFDRHNQLTDPFAGLRPPADGIVGRSVLVNGAFMPHHEVSARRYRLRILNVSQFRAYNLFLSNGAPMVQIGSDSGLMPKPVRRREILIGPAERVEVIVDFAAAAGESVELRSARHSGRNPLGARAYAGALMQFRVAAGRLPDRTGVPRRLRPLPEWATRAKREMAQARSSLGGHDRRPLQDHLADQRQDLQPRPRRRLSRHRHDRDLGDRQPHRGRPHDAHPPHRLVPARARRQAAAAVGRLPQGDLLRLPRGTDPGRRALRRLHRQVRDPLPHARSRGPRPDEPVRGRPVMMGRWDTTSRCASARPGATRS